MDNSSEPGRTLRGGQRLKGVAAKSRAGSPLVTVITAVYNGQRHMAGCLESVLRQDYANLEHIVFDGGSNDGTVDVLRKYDDRIALWKSEPDRGIYDAWNKALLSKARGEWICFLGVDDELLAGAVSGYMALARNHPLAEYLSSRVRWVHPSGYERIIGEPWKWNRFSRWMCTPHVGSMHRHSLFDWLGTYDASYRIAGDYELLLRARDQLKTAYMPTVTVTMRAGGVSDDRQSLDEQARAKMNAGGRPRLLSTIELYFAKSKFALRPLRYSLGRTKLRLD